MLIGHLSYHFFIGYIQKPIHSPPHELPVARQDLETHGTCIELACSKLGILTGGSPARASWVAVRERVRNYVVQQREGDSPHGLRESLLMTAQIISHEILQNFGMPAVYLYSFMYVSYLTSAITVNRTMPDPVTTQIYLITVKNLPEGCLADDFVASLIVTRDLYEEAAEHALSTDQIEMLFHTSLWQARNYRRCMCPVMFSTHRTVEQLHDATVRAAGDLEHLHETLLRACSSSTALSGTEVTVASASNESDCSGEEKVDEPEKSLLGSAGYDSEEDSGVAANYEQSHVVDSHLDDLLTIKTLERELNELHMALEETSVTIVAETLQASCRAKQQELEELKLRVSYYSQVSSGVDEGRKQRAPQLRSISPDTIRQLLSEILCAGRCRLVTLVNLCRTLEHHSPTSMGSLGV